MIQFNSETIIVHFGEPNALLIPVPASELAGISPSISPAFRDSHGVIEVVTMAPIDESDPVYQVGIVFKTAEAQVAFLKHFACDFHIVNTSEMGLVCNEAGAVTGTVERMLLH